MKRLTAFLFVLPLTLLCTCTKIATPYINISAEALSVPSDGEKYTITVEANYNWTAASADYWVTIIPAKGDAGTSEVVVSVDRAAKGEDRSTTVTFTCMSATKTLSLNQQASPVTESDRLVFRHHLSKFTAPEITGNGLKAAIDWGDEHYETYTKGVSHNYSSAREYTVTVEVEGQATFLFPDIKGVTEINLADF